jgi:N-acyl homoserine lactone hydrolase
VVIAGDALPTFSNYLKGVPPAQHVDRNLACMSMNRILKIADVVIPGHDLPFSVPKKAYVSQLD